MAKRTIQSAWKQYEKLANSYLDKTKPREKTIKSLNTLTRKANNDDVGESLITLFVKPHLPLDVSFKFACDLKEGIPQWQTRYDPDEESILIHPVSIVKFIREIEAIKLTDEDYEDFLHCRWMSFLSEISKLPSIYIMFMLLLQRVAYVLEIAHLEKRGGVVEVAEGEAYHTMLWAFKEFESFAKRTWSINIRARYGLSWYESEWITGR